MASDLDDLMARDPLDLSDADIDAIVAHHRNIRAKKASGEKSADAPKPKIDLSSILNKVVTKDAPKITRRI